MGLGSGWKWKKSGSMVLAGGGVCSQHMILVEFSEIFELMFFFFFFQRQVLERETKAGLQSKDHVSLVP